MLFYVSFIYCKSFLESYKYILHFSLIIVYLPSFYIVVGFFFVKCFVFATFKMIYDPNQKMLCFIMKSETSIMFKYIFRRLLHYLSFESASLNSMFDLYQELIFSNLICMFHLISHLLWSIVNILPQLGNFQLFSMDICVKKNCIFNQS